MISNHSKTFKFNTYKINEKKIVLQIHNKS